MMVENLSYYRIAEIDNRDDAMIYLGRLIQSHINEYPGTLYEHSKKVQLTQIFTVAKQFDMNTCARVLNLFGVIDYQQDKPIT